MPKQLHAYGIILRPLITEKAQTMAAQQNKYAFEVDKRANKMQIKEAVEVAFTREREGSEHLRDEGQAPPLRPRPDEAA